MLKHAQKHPNLIPSKSQLLEDPQEYPRNSQCFWPQMRSSHLDGSNSWSSGPAALKAGCRRMPEDAGGLDGHM